MKVVSVRYLGLPGKPVTVGQITYTDHTAKFEYDDNFLDLGVNLSPFALKLVPGLQESKREPFNGLHGVFADSLPDGWGMLIIDRSFKRQGVNISSVNPVDRLAFVGQRAMGALSYHQDEGFDYLEGKDGPLDINHLAEASIKLFTGDVEEVLAEIEQNSTSPGGARPKALIGLRGNEAISGAGDLPEGYGHWMVKFPPGQHALAKSEGAIEYLYSLMARESDIDFTETQLVPGNSNNLYFMTRRFDRLPNGTRVHTHTLAGLLHADFRRFDCSYETLLKACFMLTKSHAEVMQLFRRLLFNVITGNRDDHTKNFSFLMKENGEWINSPAYDLTYSRGMNGYHSLSIGTEQTITLEDILSIAHKVSITKKQVAVMIDEIVASLDIWQNESRHFNIPNDLINEITTHMDNQTGLLTP